MTPHGHTWYATLNLQSSSPLNANDMAVEFHQLKGEWKDLITNVFDHSFMCNMNDPLVEPLLKIHADARLILFPGDPTTELISLLLFSKCEKFLENSKWKDQVTVAGITIDETPTNSIHCDRAYYKENISRYAAFSGWWTTADMQKRNCHREQTPSN